MYDGAVMPLAIVSPRSAPLTFVQAGVVLLLAASLGACGSSGSKNAAQRGTYKIGAPYKIDGVTYTPQEEFNHVETGVASWYGPGFHGKSTANGEAYDQSARTAAHRTLQMPSIVRVTNLDNGMSTVVRVNDRGPFARSRVIDLSRTAAQDGKSSSVVVPIGGAQVLEMSKKQRIKTIDNADQAIAVVDFLTGSEFRKVVIRGGPVAGITKLVLTDNDDNKETFTIIVELNIEYLKRVLAQVAPTTARTCPRPWRPTSPIEQHP